MKNATNTYPDWYKKYIFDELNRIYNKYGNSFEYNGLVIEDIYSILSSIKNINTNYEIIQELFNTSVFEYLYAHFLYKNHKSKKNEKEFYDSNSIYNLQKAINELNNCQNISFEYLELDFSSYIPYDSFWEYTKIIFPENMRITELKIKGTRGFPGMQNSIVGPKKCKVYYPNEDIFLKQRKR